MTLTIDLTPAEEGRLDAVARRGGVAPTEAARRLLTASLPPVFERNGEARPDQDPGQEVMIAFEGWVDRIEDGVATLRLVDQQGRRSVATYKVTDLQRDRIPAEIGTAFQCQVIRDSSGYHVSFQPVPRRKVSEARRKQREAEMISAYGTLQNDY